MIIASTQTAAEYAADILRGYGVINAETVKSTLNKQREAQKRLETALSICSDFEQRITTHGSGTPYSSTGVSNQHNGNATESKLVRLAALNERCEALRIEACLAFAYVYDLIELLPSDNDGVFVLSYRYLIDPGDWKSVAAAVECTERNAMRLHRQALESLANILNTEAVSASAART